MKRNVTVSILALVIVLLMNVIMLGISQEVNAQDPVPACKVEVIDCPGIGTGDRQVCHANGNGVKCTCGDSTICPEEEPE